MNHSPTLSRRKFINKTASAIAGITILPSYLALGKADAAGNLPPSKRINLACIGIGGRAKGVIAQYLNEGFNFDPKTKRITNHPQANAMLNGPAPRKGWEHYYAGK